MPVDFIYPRPESVTPVQGALVEPLANAVHLFEALQLDSISAAGVLGAGAIGLMMLQALKVYTQARVIVSDINPNRLSIAKEIGADIIVDPTKDDFVRRSFDISDGIGLDLCIDAAGTAMTKIQALKSTCLGGAAVWFGLLENAVTMESYELTLKERRIVGSYSATRKDFEKSVQLFAQDKIKSESWVSEFSIHDSAKAFQRMLEAKGSDIKAVILPE